MPDEDRSLVEKARAGDRPARERLFEEYRAMAYAVGLSVCGNAHDADEVVQESFLRAFRRLGEWRGEGRFSTWLYTIAYRVALDWQSRARRKPPPPPAVEDAFQPGRQEQAERLLQAIQELPEQQRLVLTLRHYRAMSIAEIAQAQGCAEGTVKANLHFAIVKLREMLAKDLAP